MIPIMAKEWRRLLRNPGTPWALLAYLLLPLLVTGAYFAGLEGGRGIAPQMMTQLGGHSLNLVATWQILLLAVAAPFVTAALVAGEVEEGTLHPLLAAGPALPALLLAKLAAALLFLLVILVAGLPLFALPLLVGGVTWPLIGRAVLLEAVTVILMSGLGLLLSACGRRTGTVALLGVALGVFLTLGGGLVKTTPPGQVYSREQTLMMLRMGSSPPVGTTILEERVPRWLYLNPLVGLNSAINQSAGQGMLGLPGANMGPVYKEYRLWQAQAVIGPAVALLASLLATLVVTMRMRWRWPALRLRPASRR